MAYRYFAHPRFIAFREALGYRSLGNGAYATFAKHQSLVNLPSFAKRLLAFFLPELFIEADIDTQTEARLNILLAQKKFFSIRGISHDKNTFIDRFLVKEMGTFLIDLRPPIEAIVEGFDHSLRKQLKKEVAQELRFSRVEDLATLEAYYRLLRAFRDPRGFRTPSWDVIHTQWTNLHGGPDPAYELFVVKDASDTLLAGMGINIDPEGKSCMEVTIARSEEARQTPAMDVLRWGIMQWAKAQGIGYYDLAGIDPAAQPGSKTEGLLRNKKKWGGAYQAVYQYEHYFAHNRFYYPLAYHLLKWLGYIKI